MLPALKWFPMLKQKVKRAVLHSRRVHSCWVQALVFRARQAGQGRAVVTVQEIWEFGCTSPPLQMVLEEAPASHSRNVRCQHFCSTQRPPKGSGSPPLRPPRCQNSFQEWGTAGAVFGIAPAPQSAPAAQGVSPGAAGGPPGWRWPWHCLVAPFVTGCL